MTETEIVITELQAAVIRVCRENDLLKSGRIEPGLAVPQVAFRLPPALNTLVHRDLAPILADLGRRRLLKVTRRRRDDGTKLCRRYRATPAGVAAVAAHDRAAVDG